MCAAVVHYDGSSTVFGVGFQTDDSTGTVATGVTPTVALAYIQDPVSITINENANSRWYINGGNARNRSGVVKGMHDGTIRFSFAVERTLDEADSDDAFWLLKMPIDGSDSVATATYTIPDGATAPEYGTFGLRVMTIETGYNPAASQIMHTKISGVVVNSMTLVVEPGKDILWTYDCLFCRMEDTSATAATALTESTEPPFKQGDAEIKWGNAGSAAAITDVERFELTINNNITRRYDINNATSIRYCNAYSCGRREISGVMRLRLNTAAAQGIQIFEDFYGLDAATAPTDTVVLKDIVLTIYQAASKDIAYTLHDVVIGPALSFDLTGSDEQVYDIPFTATHCVLVIRATDATAPTGWAEV